MTSQTVAHVSTQAPTAAPAGVGGAASCFVAAVVAMLLLLPAAASGTVRAVGHAGRTPVVFFPGYSTTKLEVGVRNQVAAPDCPRSGKFEDFFGAPASTTFSQICRDRLLTLRYHPSRRTAMPLRFSHQRGVSVRIIDYGKTQSTSSLYEALYKALEAAGYVRDKDIRAAGYNWRLTPDMDGFLARTKRLIEDTYRINGRRPIQLVGHSNGPLYAQYLLTHTSRAWKRTYIHGFTPIAGNFPGQGIFYSYLVTGFNDDLFSLPATKENAQSSARLLASSPATYMSAADPRVFGRREVVVEDASTGRQYTPQDYPRLLSDTGLRWAKPIADYYIGFVKFADPRHFPDVDVSAEKGSGFNTQVGAVLQRLSVGQVLDPATARFLTRDGDLNQEDITNDAVLAWRGMRCFHFSLTDNPGVNHYVLPFDPAVLHRLFADLTRPRSRCG